MGAKRRESLAGSVDRAVKGGELGGSQGMAEEEEDGTEERRGKVVVVVVVVGGGECSPASLLLTAGKRVNGERVGGEGFSALRSVTRH